MRFRGLLAGLTAVACHVSAALASQPLVERIGDWDLICQSGEGQEALPSMAAAKPPADASKAPANPGDKAKPARDCRLIQSHALDAEKQNLLILSIVLAGNDRSGLAVISVPQAVYLSPRVIQFTT